MESIWSLRDLARTRSLSVGGWDLGWVAEAPLDGLRAARSY